MGKILIIPDIHGRSFWKNAVEEYGSKCDKVVFLGDYLDPYPWEGITRRDAINNFEEIILYKKEYDDKVVLLLGNHDLPYYDRQFRSRCRYDSSHAWTIERMFNNNRRLFGMAFEYDMNGKHFLFTHAGVCKTWYENHKNFIGELTVENLDTLRGSKTGLEIMCEHSYIRGGCDPVGSIVWSDVNEKKESEDIEGIYQIFGHSQQEEYPIITNTWACLDCRRAFILTEEGGFQDV